MIEELNRDIKKYKRSLIRLFSVIIIGFFMEVFFVILYSHFKPNLFLSIFHGAFLAYYIITAKKVFVRDIKFLNAMLKLRDAVEKSETKRLENEISSES